ncbi:hypothetical protein H0H93_011508 [Arthromyces matolae]|nr:hypothetical protein H0H93_011508 [Arthromyces matolae]
MLDITNNSTPKLVLLPQIVPLQLKVQPYFSKSRSIGGKLLREEKYSSNQVRVVTVEGAHRPNENVPEHFTVLITVQDEVPHDWQPAYDCSCTYDQKATSQYNLGNIQGDILPGLPKTVEYFYYFSITDDFGEIFKRAVFPKITSALKLVSQPTAQDFLGVNVGFTAWFLETVLQLPEALQDKAFYAGQRADSQFLGDAGAIKNNRWWPSSWDKPFNLGNFDGVFIITAFNESVADKFVYDLERAFSTNIVRNLLLKGTRRPGGEGQNDHFGYRGGISNPEVRGVTFDTQSQSDPRYPGSPIIPMGVVVMGYDGDSDKDTRPVWAKDSTFMVTRKLDVFVPEFEAFLLQRGPKYFPSLPPDAAADKLGSRFFGRWKDGTPTELSPDSSDASITTDGERVNNFIFQSKGQTHCPYAAHIRKCSPRNYVSPDESDNSHL